MPDQVSFSFFFFFNDTATTEIYTLSLHDALPICLLHGDCITISGQTIAQTLAGVPDEPPNPQIDRKSTRLNSSHLVISYAVFCLKKKLQHSRRHRSRSVTARRTDTLYVT